MVRGLHTPGIISPNIPPKSITLWGAKPLGDNRPERYLAVFNQGLGLVNPAPSPGELSAWWHLYPFWMILDKSYTLSLIYSDNQMKEGSMLL